MQDAGRMQDRGGSPQQDMRREDQAVGVSHGTCSKQPLDDGGGLPLVGWRGDVPEQGRKLL